MNLLRNNNEAKSFNAKNNLFLFFFKLLLCPDPILVTPEPPLKRPTHLDLMPATNFTPKKSPNVSGKSILIFIGKSSIKRMQYSACFSLSFDWLCFRIATRTNLRAHQCRLQRKCKRCANNWNNRRCKHGKHYRN